MNSVLLFLKNYFFPPKPVTGVEQVVVKPVEKPSEKEIVQKCIADNNLTPLFEAINSGDIGFVIIPRSGFYYFGMRSKGGLIEFENDIYFYTKLKGKPIRDYGFDEFSETRFEQLLSRINWGLRGYEK